jgi:hypothetical protein
MIRAYLRYRRIVSITDPTERQQLAAAIRTELTTLRSLAATTWPGVQVIQHLGQQWNIGPPERIDWNQVRAWADHMQALLVAQGL